LWFEFSVLGKVKDRGRLFAVAFCWANRDNQEKSRFFVQIGGPDELISLREIEDRLVLLMGRYLVSEQQGENPCR
jgi:hypothetical protein